MKPGELRSMFDELKPDEKKSDEIFVSILTKKDQKLFPQAGWLLYIAAVSALLFCIPSVRVFAAEKLTAVRCLLFSENGEELLIETEELHPQYSPALPYVFESVADAEEMVGITFLKSSDPTAETSGTGLCYYPMAAYDQPDQPIYGMTFQDFAYVCGDIRSISAEKSGSASIQGEIRFTPGEEYHSPIALQIRLITDAEKYAETAGGDDISHSVDSNEFFEAKLIETVNIPQLHTEAMILSNHSEFGIGPEIWQRNDRSPITQMTSAVFSYEGIEYTYYGDVSAETMKEFLNTLYE